MPSIIIAFYNKIHFLNLVLAGFDRQSCKEFEIIIADDGSDEKVVNEIKNLSNRHNFSIQHIWHEDRGWRKNKILNEAIRKASCDYLIFIDSDCVPHKHFIREHLRNRENGKILSGRRMNLSSEITSVLNEEMIRSGYLEKHILLWLIKGIRHEFTHAEKGLYLPLFGYLFTRKHKDLLGCNFSIHKSDFLKINGFDERYEAPTVGEDTDVEYRAGQAGISIKSVRNLAVQYHLYHEKLSRQNDNYLILEDTIKKKMAYTPYGIIQEKPFVL